MNKKFFLTFFLIINLFSCSLINYSEPIVSNNTEFHTKVIMDSEQLISLSLEDEHSCSSHSVSALNTNSIVLDYKQEFYIQKSKYVTYENKIFKTKEDLDNFLYEFDLNDYIESYSYDDNFFDSRYLIVCCYIYPSSVLEIKTEGIVKSKDELEIIFNVKRTEFTTMDRNCAVFGFSVLKSDIDLLMPENIVVVVKSEIIY